MSDLILWKKDKKNIISLSSAKLAQNVANVNIYFLLFLYVMNENITQ